MWLSSDNQDYPNDCVKEQGNEKIYFRSNSPPLEGGESLCEFYSEQRKDLKPLQISALSENTRDGLQNNHSNLQNIFHSIGNSKLPSKNFISLFNQDLLPTDKFTQTFLQSILSSVDSTDPVVANAWMETLLDVIDLLPEEIVKGEILTLAVNKGQLSQPVSSRLSCCKMLGKICMKFDPYVIMKEVLPIVLSLCQDVEYEVRGYMCRQLDVIAKGIGLEATKSAILPELVELANDEEIFVRLAGIETVVQMLPLLDADTCKQTIVPLVKKFCENSFASKDITLPVVSKQLGRLCHGLVSNFTPDQKQWFLKYFEQLSKLGISHQEKRNSLHLNPMPDLLLEVDNKERYQLCRHACAYNFPAMVLFAGPENFEKELYNTFKKLCSDPFPKVRQTMACGFYEVARLLKMKSSLIQPELVLLLQDESVEVLKGLIPSLPDSLRAVCSKIEYGEKEMDDRLNQLVKALIACEEATSVTSSWRLHADFLSCLSCLPSCISSETIFTTFVPLLFVKLHTARPIPCRTSAAYSLLVFLRSTPNLERRKGIINELIRELCYGRSCHKRILFIRVCELVIELFSKVFFKLHFFKPLLHLSGDPVPNIRLCLCAILPRLKSLLKLPKDSQLLQELESCIKTLMNDEKDQDVLYAMNKAIQELDKIEVATETISRRSSGIEIALDMEDWLKETEERQLLEVEFNSKFGEAKVPKACQLIGFLNKHNGKIPIRKSGTLPKSSRTCDVMGVISKNMSPNSIPNSPKSIKKQHRISSPGFTVEIQRNLSNLSSKESPVNTDQLSKTNKMLANSVSSKSTATNTWPRQTRVSSIPKQNIDRCPSPMPQPKNPSDQSTCVSSNKLSTSNAKNITNSETSYVVKDKFLKSKVVSNNIKSSVVVKKRVRSIPTPSPEILRKSATFTNLSSESKIPTSSLRRKSTIKD